MAGKGGSWGSLGVWVLKENTLETSCQELGHHHCPPTQIGGSRWWEWMKNLQSGRNGYETLKGELEAEPGKSSVPGQQAGSRAGARLSRAAALLGFYSCKEFFTPPHSTSNFFQALLKCCGLLSLST